MCLAKLVLISIPSLYDKVKTRHNCLIDQTNCSYQTDPTVTTLPWTSRESCYLDHSHPDHSELALRLWMVDDLNFAWQPHALFHYRWCLCLFSVLWTLKRLEDPSCYDGCYTSILFMKKLVLHLMCPTERQQNQRLCAYYILKQAEAFHDFHMKHPIFHLSDSFFKVMAASICNLLIISINLWMYLSINPVTIV